jgi:hypothetical protein
MATDRNALELTPGSSDLVADFFTEYDANMEIIDNAIAKCNFVAVADPTVNEDSGDGYAAGTLWFNVTGHKLFICEAATVGAAVWRQIWPVTDTGANVDFGAYEVRAATFESDVATGTAPLTIASTTKCTNLNADQLDGLDDTAFVKAAGTVALSANWDAGSYKITAEQLESDVATGTAPLVVASTTKVTNLQADSVDGNNMDTVTTKGDLLVGSGAGDLDRLGVSTNGYSLVADSGQTLGFSWAELMTDGVYRQALINGNFQVNQQAIATYTSATTPANSDDTYLHDQWVLLSDGNDIVDVSTSTTVIPTGGASSVKFDVETINKKFGYIQFIENKDAIKYAGKTASIQFKAYTVTGHVVENVRAAVLSWSSTADAVTSDVVSAWGAEGANITPAANWTLENTPANLALVADTWTTYKIENISIDTASMANLAVFIWVDDTDCALEDLLYITDVQLNQGPVCLPYLPRAYETDLIKCKRFMQFFSSAYDVYSCFGTGFSRTTTTGIALLFFSPHMRYEPVVTFSAQNDFGWTDGAGAPIVTTAMDTSFPTDFSVRLNSTVAAGLTAGQGGNLYANNKTTAWIKASAQL